MLQLIDVQYFGTACPGRATELQVGLAHASHTPFVRTTGHARRIRVFCASGLVVAMADKHSIHHPAPPSRAHTVTHGAQI